MILPYHLHIQFSRPEEIIYAHVNCLIDELQDRFWKDERCSGYNCLALLKGIGFEEYVTIFREGLREHLWEHSLHVVIMRENLLTVAAPEGFPYRCGILSNRFCEPRRVVFQRSLEKKKNGQQRKSPLFNNSDCLVWLTSKPKEPPFSALSMRAWRVLTQPMMPVLVMNLSVKFTSTGIVNVLSNCLPEAHRDTTAGIDNLLPATTVLPRSFPPVVILYGIDDTPA